MGRGQNLFYGRTEKPALTIPSGFYWLRDSIMENNNRAFEINAKVWAAYLRLLQTSRGEQLYRLLPEQAEKDKSLYQEIIATLSREPNRSWQLEILEWPGSWAELYYQPNQRVIISAPDQAVLAYHSELTQGKALPVIGQCIIGIKKISQEEVYAIAGNN